MTKASACWLLGGVLLIGSAVLGAASVIALVGSFGYAYVKFMIIPDLSPWARFVLVAPLLFVVTGSVGWWLGSYAKRLDAKESA